MGRAFLVSEVEWLARRVGKGAPVVTTGAAA
jgi:hypothetical protein